jgi:hypothetical protein
VERPVDPRSVTLVGHAIASMGKRHSARSRVGRELATPRTSATKRSASAGESFPVMTAVTA